MPRLFTALEMPGETAFRLSLVQSGLPEARWIEREDFHITLRFVGDVDRRTGMELAEALHNTRATSFQLELGGLDVFGNQKPRSLYAGIKRSDELSRLHAAHERICQQIGLEPEHRRFKPHVTIARLKNTALSDLTRYLSQMGGFESEPFQVNRFVLLSSRDSVGGGPYVIEETYDLQEHDFAKST